MFKVGGVCGGFLRRLGMVDRDRFAAERKGLSGTAERGQLSRQGVQRGSQTPVLFRGGGGPRRSLEVDGFLCRSQGILGSAEETQFPRVVIEVGGQSSRAASGFLHE